MKLLTVALIGLLVHTASAVDKTLFKTCAQSSFCRRCRKVTGPTAYEAVLSSLYTDANGITVEIRNNETQKIFLLKLGALEDDTFRFEVDEKNPTKPRYRVTEALKKNPSYEIVDVTTSSTEIIVKSKSNKAIIKLSPLQIDFYHNDVRSVSVNAKGLMHFEHHREKSLPLEPDEDPDSWEETFGGVVDTKPNGPEAVALDFTFPESDVLFGIPEHVDSFALKVTVDDEPYRLYNLDVANYELDSRMSIYGAIPVLYGHGIRKTAGVFWHNSADTFIDIHDQKSAHFMSEAGIVDVFVLLGPSPHDVFQQYTKLTGVGNLPQLFSLGYHQSRWNYMSQEEVIEVVDEFDKNELPLDTIWLDIEYTDGKRYFTWDLEAFSEPLEMMANLSNTGRHLTFIIDPHIKKDLDYKFYSDNQNRGFYVKDKDGNDFEGDCWPGLSSYVDYFNPEARKFYADQYLLENFPLNSIETGIWNDMNEPSVFNKQEVTMPRDNVHFGGWEHRNVHNLYGLMQVKGTFDGLMRRANGGLRPFILTRSFFSGSQRYAAIWTGDNTADWGYLESSIKMCLSVSVAGISFCGSDVGGFFEYPEEDLFVRWFQAAAFQPFFRAHSNIDTERHEPYSLTGPALTNVREAMRKRYALLPFWYTMFYEHERTGSPIMRPMLTEYPLDVRGFMLDSQYMLSDKLLVRPVLTKFASNVIVYFPSVDGASKGDLWYDTDDFSRIDTVGFKTIQINQAKTPVYQKGGSIIPRKETVRASSAFMVNDPISLFITVDAAKSAKGTLYIDDEKSYDYRRGAYNYMQIELNDNKLTSKHVDNNTNYQTKCQLRRVLIAGLGEVPTRVTLEKANGETAQLEIVKIDDAYFWIENPNVNLSEEWTITLSGAGTNVLGLSLMLVMLLIHGSSYLFNN